MATPLKTAPVLVITLNEVDAAVCVFRSRDLYRGFSEVDPAVCVFRSRDLHRGSSEVDPAVCVFRSRDFRRGFSEVDAAFCAFRSRDFHHESLVPGFSVQWTALLKRSVSCCTVPHGHVGVCKGPADGTVSTQTAVSSAVVCWLLYVPATC